MVFATHLSQLKGMYNDVYRDHLVRSISQAEKAARNLHLYILR